MHFKDGFYDQNAERYMLNTRVRKLLEVLRRDYCYSESFNAGPFTVVEGYYSYEEALNMVGRSFDGAQEHWGGPIGIYGFSRRSPFRRA